MAENRFCKRCLTKEMPNADYFQNMHDYIEHLDSEIKTPNELYEERLSTCKECEHLLSGMCRICGCFVEMRAAIRKNYCPDIHKKW